MNVTCNCGCPETAHQHYRKGTDCGLCGAQACPSYRASEPVKKSREWLIWAVLAVLAAAWLLATLLGWTGRTRTVQPPARIGAADSSCPAAIDQANAMLETYALMIVDAADPAPNWSSLAQRQHQITMVDQPAWFKVSEQCRAGR